MSITLQNLIDAGLPALTCDGLDATWSRDLTAQEWAKVFDIFHPEIRRKRDSITLAKAIPNWATWTPTDWATYRDANVSATQVNAIGNLAEAKAMLLKISAIMDAQAKMIIALRDHTGIVD